MRNSYDLLLLLLRGIAYFCGYLKGLRNTSNYIRFASFIYRVFERYKFFRFIIIRIDELLTIFKKIEKYFYTF